MKKEQLEDQNSERLGFITSFTQTLEIYHHPAYTVSASQTLFSGYGEFLPAHSFQPDQMASVTAVSSSTSLTRCRD